MKKVNAKKKKGRVTNEDLARQIEVLATTVHGVGERVISIEENVVSKRDIKEGLDGLEERLGSKMRTMDRRMDEFATQYVKKEYHVRLAEKVSKLEHRV